MNRSLLTRKIIKLAKHTLHTQAKYDRRIARLCIIYRIKIADCG